MSKNPVLVGTEKPGVDKILLIGANGFLGRRLARSLRGNIIFTYHVNKNPELQQQEQLDITNAAQVAAIMQKHQPDVVIMPAAISASNASKEILDKVNVLGVKQVISAMQALEHQPYFIFFSSEQVFDGTKPVYAESDTVSPENDYGRSKAAGERLVSTYKNKLILRLSLVVGKKEQGDHDTFFSNMYKPEFVVFTDVYRMPLYVEDIPPIVQELVGKRYTGTLQIAGPDYLSFDAMADIVEKSWHLPQHTRAACHIQNYPRKFKLLLDNMKRVLSYTPTSFTEAVRKTGNVNGTAAQNNHAEQKNTVQKNVERKRADTDNQQHEVKHMKALVTGGAGFIGSHLVEALINDEKFEQVIVLDSLMKGKQSSIQHLIDKGKVKLIEGDIRCRDIVNEAMQGVDYVFHTAAIHIIQSAKSPDECIDIDIKGSYNVFRSALEHKVKRVIFSSSSSVYGDPKKLPMHEDDQLYPAEPYGAAKLYCEHLLQHLQKQGLQWVALRYYNVYGERQAAHAYYTTVVTHFIKRIMNNEPPTIDGKGDQSMDFTHVSDVVRANIAAMKTTHVNQPYNVGTGVSTSIAQLADIIITALHKDIKPIFRDRDVLVTRRQADTTNAEKLLGFKAKIAVKEGMSLVAQEIAAHPEKY